MSDQTPAVFKRTCDLGIALGWDNISTLPGCQEHQIDEHWYFAINPHNEPTICSRGATVRPASIYFEFDGQQAGMVRATGGILAYGAAANADTLLAALEAAIKKQEKGAS